MNYLQSERNYTILNSISRILKQNGLEGTENLSLLADKTINKTGWTSQLLIVIPILDFHHDAEFTSQCMILNSYIIFHQSKEF